MALNIISNFAANVATRNLARTDAQVTASLSKLSSGSRVVSAKDDAASLAIGSRLRAEVAGLKQASVNAGQASSLLQSFKPSEIPLLFGLILCLKHCAASLCRTCAMNSNQKFFASDLFWRLM